MFPHRGHVRIHFALSSMIHFFYLAGLFVCLKQYCGKHNQMQKYAEKYTRHNNGKEEGKKQANQFRQHNQVR